MEFRRATEIVLNQSQIAEVLDWSERRTRGKTPEEEPYLFGAKAALEFILGLSDLNPVTCDASSGKPLEDAEE